MSELRKCPFCGGEAKVNKHHNKYIDWYQIECDECHIMQATKKYSFEFEAVEEWNRRVEDD